MRKTIFHAMRLFAITFVAALPCSLLQAQDVSPLNGTWRGTWTSPEGYVFSAKMKLNVTSDSTLDGDIKWTLKKVPVATEQRKRGLSGVEFIKGTFDSQSRVLSFEGYKKDDPKSILGLDQYRLILADNNKVIGGITGNHGRWTAVFLLERDEASKE